MSIHKKVILFLLTLIVVVKGFSQEDTSTIKTTVPISLYTILPQLPFETQQNINKKLDLTSFKFIILNKKDIEDGFFTFYPKNLKRTPTTYIYDDYKYVYLDRYLFKGFDLRKFPEIRNISPEN